MPKKKKKNNKKKNNKPVEKRRYKQIGVTIQITLYVLNGCVWLVAFFSFGFGIVIGLSSNTIGVGSDFDPLDFIITTPATLFVIYGMLLLTVTFVGCFAAVSAYCCTNVIYCVLILILFLMDGISGICLFFRSNAYNKFIKDLNNSISGYGNDSSASKVGLFPLDPNKYWDHFQRKGKCCGLYDFLDWRNSTFGREEYSLPDSCCSQDYEYEGCGFLAWKHPDHGVHTMTSIIHERSCLSIFPPAIQEDKDRCLDSMGKVVFTLLLFCMVFSGVLIFLVMKKHFKPEIGLANPSFLEAPEDPTLFEERVGRRVHPEISGEGDVASEPDDRGAERQKRLRFNENGPLIIGQTDE